MRVGLVGCGPIARHHHGPGWRELPDVEVVAVCDVAQDNADSLGAEFGARAFYDVTTMLESVDLDVVDVVTSEGPRPPLLLTCLQAGKHVFTEKPLAGANGQYNIQLSDIPQLHPIIDEWLKQGTKFGINFNLRQSENVRKLKEVIDSGALGAPEVVEASTHMGSTNHVIDLLRWLNGDVEQVSAVGRGDPKHPTRAAHLSYANGSIGTFINSMVTDLYFDVNYLGSKGRAIARDITGGLEIRKRDEGAWLTEWKEVWEPSPVSPQTYGGIFRQSIANFAAVVRGESNDYATGLDGLRHMEIDAAITESMNQGGKPVTIERYQPSA
ncbi:MAG: Gfo/Idh/MocA family oxidoreductase [Thermomicrobiales bacterium]|nr:Gfo/Idh/MocA family oxidoreductase [Thermomicrobiales bacterium]